MVTFCGSCVYAIAKELPRLLDRPQAMALGGSVLEISQFLAEHPRLLEGLGRTERPVAVHDPYHLKVRLGVHEEPRQMLRRAGVELVEMKQADACCDGGGLFGINQSELSRGILEPQQRALLQSGASVLVTSCSGRAVCRSPCRCAIP